PGPQRPAVRLAPSPVEMAIGLQERLLGEVLGVVLVANPVVGVGIDVAQVSAVEVLESAVELGLRRGVEARRLDVLLGAHGSSLVTSDRWDAITRPSWPARHGAGPRPRPRRRSPPGSGPPDRSAPRL